MEAAIRASLQETHFDSEQIKQESRSDEESESELFSGSEEFISVCGSDDDEPESSAKSRKSPHKDLGCRKEEGRKPQPEPTSRTEPEMIINHRGLSSVDSGVLEETGTKLDDLQKEPSVNGKYGSCHLVNFRALQKTYQEIITKEYFFLSAAFN